ncbi:MAG: hypothetical protein ACYDBB_05075 [Armatimonadota bacterium]
MVDKIELNDCQLENDDIKWELDDAGITAEDGRALRVNIAIARSKEFGLPELTGRPLRMRQAMLLMRDQLHTEYEQWQRSHWRYELSDQQWAMIERLVGRIFQMTAARWYARRTGASLLELLTEQIWIEIAERKRQTETVIMPPLPEEQEEADTAHSE